MQLLLRPQAKPLSRVLSLEHLSLCGTKPVLQARVQFTTVRGPLVQLRASRLLYRPLQSSSSQQMPFVEELSELDRSELAADAVVWASQHGLVRSCLCNRA